jgi:DNA-directed RNA polymerase I subunit RPA49
VVVSRLGPALRNKDSQKIKLLFYLAYLMRFYTLTFKDLQHTSAALLSTRFLAGASQQIAESLLSQFTEYTTGPLGQVQYRCPDALKDKLLAYICALLLHLDDFMVQINPLQKDLKLSIVK